MPAFSQPPQVSLLVRPLLGVPDNEAPFNVRAWASAPVASHWSGVLGGVVWAVGTVCSLISGKAIGMALSFSIGQSSVSQGRWGHRWPPLTAASHPQPMVATVWGLFWYKEFAGAPRSAWMFIWLMFAAYACAIGLMAAAK